MLGHAPPPLTASGLDMRGGHPAEGRDPFGSASEVLTPRRRIKTARSQIRSPTEQCKRVKVLGEPFQMILSERPVRLRRGASRKATILPQRQIGESVDCFFPNAAWFSARFDR
jgi:hypothetical protein